MPFCILTYHEMCPKLNVLVLSQNALLTACMVLKWFMSIMSYSAKSRSAHTYTHKHCFPVKRHWLLCHVAQIWKLDNRDMAAYIKDKCMNTIISLLTTCKQQEAKWAYVFCIWEFCCSQNFSACLKWSIPHFWSASQPWREVTCFTCMSSSNICICYMW